MPCDGTVLEGRSHIDESSLPRSADDSVIERPAEKLRKDGDEIESHDDRSALGLCTVTPCNGIADSGIQVAEPFQQHHVDAPSVWIDFRADILGEGNQQFAL